MNKTITIIELLNRIAKGEEIPKRIRYEYNGDILTLNEDNNYINNKTHNRLIDYMSPLFCDLNKELEIVEDKEPIDIDYIEEIEIDKNGFIHTEEGAFKGRKMDIAFARKFDEIIRFLKQINKERGKEI